MRRQTFRAYLREIQTKITSVSQDDFYTQNNMTDYILLYDTTRESKEDFLQLMNFSVHLENAHRDIAEFFEETINLFQKKERLKIEIKEMTKIRVHELYLYAIAYYLIKIKTIKEQDIYLEKHIIILYNTIKVIM